MKLSTPVYAALAGIGALLAAGGTALATMPSGPGGPPTPIAGGSLLKPANINEKVAGGSVTIKTHGAIDTLMLEITSPPGSTSGWHEHAGPRIEIVKKGTVTFIDAKCRSHTMTAGQAEIVSGNTLVNEENHGTKPAVIDVAFLLPHSAMGPRIDEPAPAGCTK
jgi:quercetin dioxygenase-like cupin family protein